MISEAVFFVMLFVFGAIFGSFLCCQVRRIYEKERGRKFGKWSVCMNCGRRLSAFENIPILSWMVLRGKCRGCGKKIGVAEVLSEVFTAVVFVLVGLSFDVLNAGVQEWAGLLIQLIFVSILMFVAIFDGIYGEMPGIALTILAICAIMGVILERWSFVSVGPALLSGAIFGGMYLILYLMSKGKWVGDGDFLVAGAISVMLGTPFAGLVAISVANVLACVVMAPVVAKKKDHKIYFGPFLAAGYVVAMVLLKYGIIGL